MNLGFVTIVSGLPRSGTSMMMQALEAGGIAAVTDKIRTADEDNPKGYYEFEPVKKTKEDASWVVDAVGKVVKMVYMLLYDLPEGQEYRVVFMQRELSETLASQKKMLQRSGRKGATLTDEQMSNAFRKQLEKFDSWVKDKSCFKILKVNYRDMIDDPAATSAKISEFLGGELDTQAMARVVDPTLYRNRSQGE